MAKKKKDAWADYDQAINEANKRIDNGLAKSVDALLVALEATRESPRIVGRDAKGAPEYEYIEVPDHAIRIKAAIALLNKRIPDVQRMTLDGTGKDGKIVFEVIKHYDGIKS
jgi:hypothetical protein